MFTDNKYWGFQLIRKMTYVHDNMVFKERRREKAQGA